MTGEPRPPHTRESSNGKDAADPTAETPVRGRAPRSIVKSLQVRPVTSTTVRDLIERSHYLHAFPAGAIANFGVYHGDRLVGAAVITTGARASHRILDGGRPGDVMTLARLWLTDAVPRNGESRVLAIVVRTLRREDRAKLLVTHADPSAGHTGTIYQAAGFLYLGRCPPGSLLEIDGTIQHPRTASTVLGSNSVRHLRATGVDARRVIQVPKHRYVVFLDRAWAWRLRAPVMPFPSERAPPART